MQFQIRIFDAVTGTVTERTIQGDNEAEVARRLQADGQALLSIAPVKAGGERWRRWRRSGFDTVLFCEELRTLLSSGMSLVEAIEALCAKGGSEQRSAVLDDIRRRLLDGKPLSAALASNGFGFPALLVASVRASERSSRVGEALDEYIGYETAGRELGRTLVSSAIYPGLVVAFGFMVSVFMISYVVPRFANVYQDVDQTLSAPTRILMQVGQYSSDHFSALAATAAAIAGALWYFQRKGMLKTWLLRALGKSRIARHHLRLYQLTRVYQTLSMLLKGGYTISDAIPLAQGLAFDPALRDCVERARLAILEGRRLSSAFAEHDLADSVTERLLQVGERAGSLVKVMDIIATTYRQELTLFMERAARLVEPVLLMAVAIMIGAIIVLMYMPIFDLAGGL